MCAHGAGTWRGRVRPGPECAREAMSGSAHRSASALTVRPAVTYDLGIRCALASREILRGNGRRDCGTAIRDGFRGLRMGTELELHTETAEGAPAASLSAGTAGASPFVGGASHTAAGSEAKAAFSTPQLIGAML